MLELLVQTTSGASNLASTTAAFANPTTSNNSIIVAIGGSSTTAGDVSGVTDSQNNTYTKIFATANATLGELELWYALTLSGALTL